MDTTREDAHRHELRRETKKDQVTELYGNSLERFDEDLRDELKGHGFEAGGGGSIVYAKM